MRLLPAAKSCAGLSLVELVVALAISGGVALVLMQVFNRYVNDNAALDQQAEVDDLRMTIRTGINCQATAKAMPANCARGEAIAVFRRGSSTPWIKIPAHSNVSKIGKFYVRANCPYVYEANLDWYGSVVIRYGLTASPNEVLSGVPIVCRAQ